MYYPPQGATPGGYAQAPADLQVRLYPANDAAIHTGVAGHTVTACLTGMPSAWRQHSAKPRGVRGPGPVPSATRSAVRLASLAAGRFSRRRAPDAISAPGWSCQLSKETKRQLHSGFRGDRWSPELASLYRLGRPRTVRRDRAHRACADRRQARQQADSCRLRPEPASINMVAPGLAGLTSRGRARTGANASSPTTVRSTAWR